MFASRSLCGRESRASRNRICIHEQAYRDAGGKHACVPLVRQSSRSNESNMVRERMSARGSTLEEFTCCNKKLKLPLWVSGSQLSATH